MNPGFMAWKLENVGTIKLNMDQSCLGMKIMNIGTV